MAYIESGLAVTAKAEAIKELLDGGTFKVFGGSIPATLADADSASLLAVIQLESPAFGVVTDGQMSIVVPSPTTWIANGTATHFRTYVAGSPETPIGQGSVGTSGTDAIITSTTATIGGAVALLGFDYEEPMAA